MCKILDIIVPTNLLLELNLLIIPQIIPFILGLKWLNFRKYDGKFIMRIS